MGDKGQKRGVSPDGMGSANVAGVNAPPVKNIHSVCKRGRRYADFSQINHKILTNNPLCAKARIAVTWLFSF